MQDKYDLSVKENLEGALVANLSYYLKPDHLRASTDPKVNINKYAFYRRYVGQNAMIN